MTAYDLTDQPAVDRTGRRGSIILVLLVALVLIAAAAGLVIVGRERAEPYILVLLSVLGMIGVFSLFAVAAGILRALRVDAESNPILQTVVDGAVDKHHRHRYQWPGFVRKFGLPGAGQCGGP